MGTANRQQGPGIVRRCKDCFAVAEWDDLVVTTVNDQYRTKNVPNIITCCVTETGSTSAPGATDKDPGRYPGRT